jgi:AraC-like DNA-binding protein/DNA-binding NarL/FixJ family response regulator
MRLLEEEPVDLILLDILMAGTDGITFLQQLRAQGTDVPVVVLSAINTACTAVAAMRLGAIEAADFRPPEDTARILLMGCPVGMAAAVTSALCWHARVESIPAEREALAAVPAVSPDMVVIDLERAAHPHQVLWWVRARFPLASMVILQWPGRETLRAEANGATLLSKPVFMRDLLEVMRVDLRPSLHGLPHFSPRVLGVIDYVSEHFADVSMRELGQALEKSPYYLSRLFRAETGMTLKVYVNRVRVEAARRLLLETSEKIETVAALAGFHDASHLSRQFLKHSGRRPGDYRRTWWEDPVRPSAAS